MPLPRHKARLVRNAAAAAAALFLGVAALAYASRTPAQPGTGTSGGDTPPRGPVRTDTSPEASAPPTAPFEPASLAAMVDAAGTHGTPADEPRPDAVAAPTPPPEAAPDQSGWKFLGAILSPRGNRALVAIGSQQRLLREGQSITGTEIVRVRPTELVVRSGGEERSLPIQPRDLRAMLAAGTPPHADPAGMFGSGEEPHPEAGAIPRPRENGAGIGIRPGNPENRRTQRLPGGPPPRIRSDD